MTNIYEVELQETQRNVENEHICSRWSRAILQRTMVDSRRIWPLKLATCEILYLDTLEKSCTWIWVIRYVYSLDYPCNSYLA
jgi:hypothetical protein